VFSLEVSQRWTCTSWTTG